MASNGQRERVSLLAPLLFLPVALKCIRITLNTKFIYCVHVHALCREVRGYLAGIGSNRLLCVYLGSHSGCEVVSLGGKPYHLLSHLTGQN